MCNKCRSNNFLFLTSNETVSITIKIKPYITSGTKGDLNFPFNSLMLFGIASQLTKWESNATCCSNHNIRQCATGSLHVEVNLTDILFSYSIATLTSVTASVHTNIHVVTWLERTNIFFSKRNRSNAPREEKIINVKLRDPLNKLRKVRSPGACLLRIISCI